MADLNLKIIFLESSDNLGGQELQLIQQMQTLNQRGCETLLICRPDSRILKIAKVRSLNCVTAKFSYALHIPSIFKVIAFLFRIKPDAVITHSAHDANVGALATHLFYFMRNRKTKIIRMKTYQSKERVSSLPYNVLFDKTFTPSYFLRTNLLKNSKVNPLKVKVLYPGVDFDNLDSDKQPLPVNLVEWLSNRSGPIMSHGAILRGEKGHRLILRALPKILQSYPNLRYVIAGDGPLRGELESFVLENKLEENVFFAGMLNNLASLLKISSLSILPSSREPLGMFQIESQYLCVPTLASDVGGVVETILDEKTGLLVDACNIDQWAEKIIWALANLNLMKDWAIVGSGFVKEKFSVEKNIQQLIDAIAFE